MSRYIYINEREAEPRLKTGPSFSSSRVGLWLAFAAQRWVGLMSRFTSPTFSLLGPRPRYDQAYLLITCLVPLSLLWAPCLFGTKKTYKFTRKSAALQERYEKKTAPPPPPPPRYVGFPFSSRPCWCQEGWGTRSMSEVFDTRAFQTEQVRVLLSIFFMASASMEIDGIVYNKFSLALRSMKISPSRHEWWCWKITFLLVWIFRSCFAKSILDLFSWLPQGGLSSHNMSRLLCH
jgi:hypothetical protein